MSKRYIAEGMDIKPKGRDIKKWVICPVCKGRGYYYVKDPKEVEYQRGVVCENCYGIGYTHDDSHEHKWIEIPRSECLKRGIPHWGGDFKVWECEVCGFIFTSLYFRFR